ncbi:hypothetical protein [Nocardia farcinica]
MTTVLDTDSRFIPALAQVDYLLSTNRSAARRLFARSLVEATPEEFGFLDEMAEMFSRYPFREAQSWLTGVALRRPELSDLIIACAPDTDPGLYSRRQAGLDIVEVELEQAYLPRSDFRCGGPRDLALHRPPTRAMDAARMRPDRVAERIRRRTQPAATEQMSERRHAQAAYDDYTTRHAYRVDIDEASPPATELDRRPRHSGRVDRRPELADDHRRRMWDSVYFDHVADQYTVELRDAWDAARRPATADRAAAEAHAMLQAAGDLPATRRPQQHQPSRRRISDAERQAFAKDRTGIDPDDGREPIPYQGNGIDDVHAAMHPVAGWRCVSCFIERALSDQRPLHQRGGHLVSDDGLCGECREALHPGIPSLPQPFTFDQFVLSRCLYLTRAYPQAAVALLAEVYRRAAPHPICRIINRFCHHHFGAPAVAANRTAPPATTRRPAPARTPRRPTLGAGQHHGRCDGCVTPTIVNADGYCTPCRIRLGLHSPTDTSAA